MRLCCEAVLRRLLPTTLAACLAFLALLAIEALDPMDAMDAMVARAVPLSVRARATLEVRPQPVPSGFAVAGVLRDDQGEPLAGERVVVVVQGRETALTTGTDGAFELLLPPEALAADADDPNSPENVEWSVSYSGGASYGGATEHGELDLRRRTTTLALEVAPRSVLLDGTAVVLTVRLRTAEEPVVEAPVRIRLAHGPERIGRTDAKGVASFLIRPEPTLGAGELTLAARYLGDHRYAPASAGASFEALLPTRVTLRVGREGEAATGRYRFSGRVVDEAGPVRDATIAILAAPLGKPGSRQVALVATDEHGIFITAVEARTLFEDATGALEVRAAYRPTEAGHAAALSRTVPIPVPPLPGVPARWYLAGLLWVLAGIALAHVVRHRLWEVMVDAVRRPTPPPPVDEPAPSLADPAFVTSADDTGAPRRADWVGGRVTDAHSAGPVDAVHVLVVGAEGQVVARGVTDVEGGFSLGPLESGAYNLTMAGAGYLPRQLSFATPHGGHLDGATFALVAVRRRIRDIYANAVLRHDGRLQWGRDTPAEALLSTTVRSGTGRSGTLRAGPGRLGSVLADPAVGMQGVGEVARPGEPLEALARLNLLVERAWFAPSTLTEDDAKRALELLDATAGRRNT